MDVADLLRRQAEDAYRATDGMMAMVKDDELGWRPAGDALWMTMGELLHHLPEACGACARAFMTGDWSPLMAPGGAEGGGPPPMKSASSVAGARAALAADRAAFLETIAAAGGEALAARMTTAPWNPVERPLGFQMEECIQHLLSHKSQLFYYLKMLGRPVHTGHLWGIEMPGA